MWLNFRAELPRRNYAPQPPQHGVEVGQDLVDRSAHVPAVRPVLDLGSDRVHRPVRASTARPPRTNEPIQRVDSSGDKSIS
jgi:hypothetical protein